MPATTHHLNLPDRLATAACRLCPSRRPPPPGLHVHPAPPLPVPALRPAGEIPLDVTFEFLCSYLAELTLMDYGMLNYLPSTVAASCATVALFMLNKPTWSPTLSHYSGYLPRDLRHCAQAVHQLYVAAKSSNLPASRDKYASPKFASVSQLGCADALPEWMFQ